MNALAELVADRGTVLLDGAMGTELFDRGLPTGESPERWNVEEPDRVTAVHTDYIAAGSDIVLTNTFGGTANRLKLHKVWKARCVEINLATAAKLPAPGGRRRRPAGRGRGLHGADSVTSFEPLGPVTHEQVCGRPSRRRPRAPGRGRRRRAVDRDASSAETEISGRRRRRR